LRKEEDRNSTRSRSSSIRLKISFLEKFVNVLLLFPFSVVLEPLPFAVDSDAFA